MNDQSPKDSPPQMLQHSGGHRNNPQTARPGPTLGRLLDQMTDRAAQALAQKAAKAAEAGELDSQTAG